LDSLPFTAEQIACIVLVIDAETLEELVGGAASITSIGPVLEALTGCGISLIDLLAIDNQVGVDTTLDDATGGDVPLDIPELLPGSLDAPDISEIVETGDIEDLTDLAGDLPFSTEQVECLTEEIDLEQIEALVAGEVDPLSMLSLIGVFSTCDVSLDDLGN
jgi:hypothetical protein